ncbi:putative T6SS immunity periplasmic lipoprotein [Enterobacter sp. UNJFSC 003]|uniref:putative T6SS immunity periplasmic lipoprotein n=1 Tax=Enterobacter sp. UNJFSC 003 TaxID=3122077 RepID=UPI002FF08128
MVMKHLFGVLMVTVMASACVSHTAQYQSLSVTLKNNEPCFAIPANSGLEAPITSHSPTIMKRAGNEWKTISPPSTYSPAVTLNAQHCHQWRGIAWQTGEYDVALKVSGKNNSVRYAARFTLEENSSGQFKITQTE